MPALSAPDLDYWKAQIKCQAACPVNTDARGYVRAIAEGNDELAYLIARGPNPLASICGRVCGAPCEQSCRRGDLDQPIAIRALKRFACERFGPETRTEGGRGLVDFLREAAQRHGERECEGTEELLPLLRATLGGDVPPADGRSVGIIGSGPAGLAAAHDLALLGFRVTIYEMEEVLAGMLALGIPQYRLPRELIRAEVEVILALGVEAVTGCQVGRDVTLSELRDRHDAV
ncbi:MAG: NAD(P)-binding protein, partial [Gammaproteobacteria bacterium]|nr:NAD(P)-binding protein [Gammaproteobacteria bacterium]